MLHRPGVIALFTSQYWVATTTQLADLGVSRHAVDRACRAHLVVRLARGVVGVVGACDSFESRAMSAQLAAAPHGFLSGPTAGAIYGLRRMSRDVIEVTVPETFALRWPHWVRAVRTSWLDDEERSDRNDGFVVGSPLRTLFDLARCLDQRRFEQAAEDLWHRELIDPGSAARYLARIRRRGRTGVAAFEAWLERVGDQHRPAASGLEQLLVDLAARAGLPDPVRQHPLLLSTGIVIHLDLAWPDVCFAVEPGHSWWHGGDAAMRADQERDRLCAELGWQVIRYDETVWDRRDQTMRELARLYEARRHSFGPRGSL